MIFQTNIFYPTINNESKEERVYEGMKFLIGTSPQSPFTGDDKRGRPYANSLVQMDRDGDWLVVKNPERGDHIAIRSEGKVYEYQLNNLDNPFYSTRRDDTSSTAFGLERCFWNI